MFRIWAPVECFHISNHCLNIFTESLCFDTIYNTSLKLKIIVGELII